ncbi:MAG: CoB--CoM heterodisulfide reductase iron-sulfur subunit A family protein [Conexivisphaerales archaeon]
MSNEKRIGVYVCHCGGNISDYVDVNKVVEEIKKEEPDAVIVKDLMFDCADASQSEMIDDIKKQKLDRVVVAACSPKLHETTFRNMAKRAGLNPFMLYHVDIREQASWAHENNRMGATLKALAHVRAGIAYVKSAEPLEKIKAETTRSVLIIGGGIAGLKAAIDLSAMDVNVVLIERSSKLGGHVAELGEIYPYYTAGSEIVKNLVDELSGRGNVAIFTNATVVSYSGYLGKFEVKVQRETSEITLQVGSIIVATGFDTYKPYTGEYGYEKVRGVITISELARVLSTAAGDGSAELIYDGRKVRQIAFIYCVGSRQKPPEDGGHANQYCSRYCCNAATSEALTVHRKFKDIKIYHFYRDMRTYGRNELMYESAGRSGSIFIRFDEDHPPLVAEEGNRCKITFWSSLIENQPVDMYVDLVVLITGMVPSHNEELNRALSLPVGVDGFYKEVHPKLRPVETNVTGILICGTSQAPRDVRETLSSASAAAAKAASFVLKRELELDPFVAFVDPGLCEAHQECIKECPYGAIELIEESGKKMAHVNSAKCKGCGACVAVCPTGAMQLKGYTNAEIKSMIGGLAR